MTRNQEDRLVKQMMLAWNNVTEEQAPNMGPMNNWTRSAWLRVAKAVEISLVADNIRKLIPPVGSMTNDY